MAFGFRALFFTGLHLAMLHMKGRKGETMVYFNGQEGGRSSVFPCFPNGNMDRWSRAGFIETNVDMGSLAYLSPHII
ncbi:hypothetical protein DFP73DRAFT_544325 [Morchella snyderi]|nr:hypothetical protein DFP73DRAFT_544325 [Morchella snyderi]